MLIPTTCLTCGFELGAVAELFLLLRKKRLAAVLAERNVVTKRAANDLAVSMDLTEVFEKLGVPHDCCRTCLATTLIWTEQC